ncbi:MAG: TonB-dependent receptor [Saprospiraceae bacterium]|nr:TonB-dependent receptor [Saprospiraceae bacterium]
MAIKLLSYIYFIFLLSWSHTLNAQSFTIAGEVVDRQGPVEYASITLNQINATYSDTNGTFAFNDLSIGEYDLTISFLGYKEWTKKINITESEGDISIKATLEPDLLLFDEIVVTGTKTFKRKTKSAVIVNVVDSKTLDNIQACNLSEGLKFQPGLRVETDCQTCNYTQLRMNGLPGGYSQILINGRPIFSPLTGLYGLEQIPVNMIDRIEVVRGGGSSLYGSSAIGGTVNVLTKLPKANNYTIGSLYQNLNGKTNDFQLNANATIVSPSKKSGVSLFLNKRDREAYDHNNDNFSEIPEIQNTSIGISTFFLPSGNQKIEVSLSNLNEYRFGGEIVEGAAHLALQSEERTHDVWMGSADYQINFNDEKSSIITYLAWQNTARDHYTGIFPDADELEAVQQHLEAPPYGNSSTTTFQGGVQLNHNISNFLGGSNVFTFGGEYLLDDTFDEIKSYRYEIDQVTKDLGLFVQSDWEILPSLNLLSGLRVDNHNLIDGIVASPRLSLLYKYKQNTQVRASFGTGFRAPQAFDTDLHIAFAGGGISRVQLDENLKEESSRSYSLSLNYDKPSEHWVAGFTLEGFYTRLDDAFTLVPIGEDEFGELFEKRNDQGATVQGLILELRANYDRKVQLESGITVQSSEFENEIQYIDEVPGVRDFIRTPNVYGFANLSFTPNQKFSANINYIYTGTMLVPHFAGAPNQLVDEIITSPTFSEISTKLAYTVSISKETNLEFYGGVKNMFNSYQENFDIGKNRDSNFVFGPAQPRVVYIGMKWFM